MQPSRRRSARTLCDPTALERTVISLAGVLMLQQRASRAGIAGSLSVYDVQDCHSLTAHLPAAGCAQVAVTGPWILHRVPHHHCRARRLDRVRLFCSALCLHHRPHQFRHGLPSIPELPSPRPHRDFPSPPTAAAACCAPLRLPQSPLWATSPARDRFIAWAINRFTSHSPQLEAQRCRALARGEPFGPVVVEIGPGPGRRARPSRVCPPALLQGSVPQHRSTGWRPALRVRALSRFACAARAQLAPLPERVGAEPCHQIHRRGAEQTL